MNNYINYGYIAWESEYKTKFQNMFTYQKKAVIVIFLADGSTHGKPLMLDMNTFTFYQMNIYKNLIVFYKVNTGTAPSIFFIFW